VQLEELEIKFPPEVMDSCGFQSCTFSKNIGPAVKAIQGCFMLFLFRLDVLGVVLCGGEPLQASSHIY